MSRISRGRDGVGGMGNGSGSLPAWLQHVQASDVYNDTSREIQETLWKPALSGRCNG
ncbi:hypothetical protein HDV62DRAFT_366641 [Trichoderma sp. SZMC 28011]